MFYLTAVIFIAMFLAVGCEKEETKDDEGTIIYGTLKDIDGNLYRTIKFGQQEWMAENLRVTRYNDGEVIHRHHYPAGEVRIIQGDRKDGRYGNYPHELIDGIDSDTEVIEAYGLHYNWYAVETKKLCPAGWRVPGLSDWEELSSHLMDNYPHIENSLDVAAALRSCRQEDSPLGDDCNTYEHPRWNKEGINYWSHLPIESSGMWIVAEPREKWPLTGTDEFGFSAMPAGKYIALPLSGIWRAYGIGFLSEFWVDHIWTKDIPTFNWESLKLSKLLIMSL